MNSMNNWATQFSQAVRSGKVDACFDKWVHTKSEHYSYHRIAENPERVPSEPGLYLWASNRRVDGIEQIVPRYVGRAKSTLTLRKRIVSTTGTWGRVAGRYVLQSGVSPGQCPPQGFIACEYQATIARVIGSISNTEYAVRIKELLGPRTNVLDRIFPRGLLDSFRSSGPGHPGSDLRLRHAVDWALHGGANLEYLWAAFLPTIEELEEQVKRAAIQWLTSHSLPPLLNSR